MRTSSMSSGTTLLSRAPAPQSQSQQPIGSGLVGNNQGSNLIGQLPSTTNPALLKAAAGAQNVKMFQAASNSMPMVGSVLNHHRGTPPMAPTFQFNPQRPNQLPQNPQQRIIGFQPGLDTPVLNNESEFPSLNTRSSPAPLPSNTPNNNNIFGQHQFNLQQAMSMYPSATKDVFKSIQQQRMPYANTLSRAVDSVSYGQTNEFTLQSEDFPALPGASQQQLMQGSLNAAVGGGTSLSFSSSGQTNSTESQLLTSGQTNFGAQSNFYNNTARSSDFFTNGANDNLKDTKLSINASNGVVSNIPPGMLCDQYGIVGLLMFMKGLDHYPGLSALSIGLDITKLGLNMNTNGNLYQSFGGPWSEQPCRIQDHEAKVPDEYLTNSVIREKLPTIKVNKLSEDILFYLFYNCPGQVYQLAAASELYQRDWRYHKADAVWLTRMPYGNMKEQTQEYETGSYSVFDPILWRRLSKEMKLEYKMLEGKPMPANPLSNPP